MNAKLTTSIVVLLVALAAAPLGAAATTASAGPQPTAHSQIDAQQDTANNSTATTGKQIDSTITLVSSSYNPTRGTATLVLNSDAPRRVTLSDAGGFMDGGHINRRTVSVDGRTTVEFSVTETSRGYVGVSIATDQVLYGEVIQSPNISPFRDSSGTVGWLAGAGIVLVSFVGAALWKLRNEGGEPVEASV